MPRLLAFFILLCLAMPADAAESLGTVGRLQGQAEAERAATVFALSEGESLRRGDLLRTGDGARLRVDLSDGSVLTLGERAELRLNDVVVPEAPAGDDGPFMELLSGAFRLVAAKISDSQAADRRVRTPVATIGIRGTDFWGGPLEGALDVLLLEGSVAVSTPQGSALLAAPGEGVVVPAEGAAPEPVRRWGQDKVDRAVATVTFEGD